MDGSQIVGPEEIRTRYGVSVSQYRKVLLPRLRPLLLTTLGPRCHRWRLADVVAALEAA